MSRTMSKDLIAACVQKYARGERIKEIADGYGFSANAVRKHLKRVGVAIRRFPLEKLSAEQKAQLVNDYIKHQGTTWELADRYGVSQRAVYTLLVRRGVCLRPSGGVRKYHLNERAFDELNEHSAYWAGFLMADGSVGRCRPTITLGLANKDREHVEKFRKFLGSTHPIIEVARTIPLANGSLGTPRSQLCVCSSALVAALARLGIVPAKTFTARAEDPQLFFNRHFWRGVVDGDGTVCDIRSRRGTLDAGLRLVGSRPLVSQFANYVRSVSPQWAGAPRPARNIFVVSISGPIAMAVLHSLYGSCEIALERKLVHAHILLRMGRWATQRRHANNPACHASTPQT